MKRVIIILLAVLVLVFFTGCLSGIGDGSISIDNGEIDIQDDEGGDADGMDESDSAGDEDGDADMTEEGTSGETDSGDGSLKIDLEGDLGLPEGYPSDVVPLYEPARVSLTNKFETSGGGTGFEVQYQSNAGVTEVHEYYVGLLEGNEFFTDMEMSPSFAVGGVKGGYAVTLVTAPAADDPDMTSVTIGLEETSME